jgi:acyl-ACP thioesterase
MDNKNIDRFPFFAETFLTDSRGRVRPTTILNSMHSAGNRHAEARGFGATDSLGWVIARMALHIERNPMQRERLCIDTWIRNLYHGFTDRCMRMIDEEGNEVASMITTFAMIDLKTRTSADLNGDIGLRINECLLPDEQLILRRIPSINRTPVEETAFRRRPHYSDIDVNGHMNSIRYIDHILDAMPMEYIDSHDLTDITVAYMQECHATEELSYGIKELAPDHYIAQVTKGNGIAASRFELRFKSRD